jgi:hypothetical protein
MRTVLRVTIERRTPDGWRTTYARDYWPDPGAPDRLDSATVAAYALAEARAYCRRRPDPAHWRAELSAWTS